MRIDVITSTRGGPCVWGEGLVHELNKRGYDARLKNSLKHFLLLPFFTRADVVHSTMPLAFKFWKKPLVMSIHGNFMNEKKIYRRLYKMALNIAKVITTPSQFMYDAVPLPEKTQIIPNCVEPIKYENTLKEPSFITVMNFDFKDKAEGLKKVIAMLSRMDFKEYSYTVVGDGKYLEDVKKFVKELGLDINFVGYQTNVYQYLQKATLFIYYSELDNFPLVLLEAMNAGVPVITNNVGAVKEFIKDGVDGFVAEDNEDYEKKLRKLTSDVLLSAQISEAALKSVQKNYLWEKVIEEYIEIYEEMVK